MPNSAPHDVREIVGSALRRADKILARHQVELELAEDLPMLELDAVLFEQVLFNLLDNAAKYAPVGSTIRVKAWRDEDVVCLQILDEGDGIPPEELQHTSTSSIGCRRWTKCGRVLDSARDFPRLRGSHEWDDQRGEPC